MAAHPSSDSALAKALHVTKPTGLGPFLSFSNDHPPCRPDGPSICLSAALAPWSLALTGGGGSSRDPGQFSEASLGLRVKTGRLGRPGDGTAGRSERRTQVRQNVHSTRGKRRGEPQRFPRGGGGFRGQRASLSPAPSFHSCWATATRGPPVTRGDLPQVHPELWETCLSSG